MVSKAKSKYVRVSPYKLRPFADVIRGYTVQRALAWLKTCSVVNRVRPIEKVISSAYANAKQKTENLSMNDLFIKEIKVDQGPTFKYHKPTARGRAAVQRKRLSHVEVVLASIDESVPGKSVPDKSVKEKN